MSPAADRRVRDGWLLRTDTEAGDLHESELLAQLKRAGISTLVITEEAFWKAKSAPF